MPVKIRLARRGRTKKPYYHIVIADARAPRDGKFIEQIGYYNPMTVPASIDVDRDKAYEWLMKGAQPTNTVRAILKFKGVYYRKHLMRGVAKGSFSEEKAMEMYQDWINAKEEKIAARVEQTKKEKEEFWKMVSGEIKPSKKKADEAAAEAFREGEAEGGDAPTAEAEAATPEAPAQPEAPAAPEVKAEAPAKEEPKKEEPAKEAPKAEEPVKEEPKKEEPKKEEPKKEEAPAAEAAAPVVAAAAATADAKPDDLTKIEGIGPAISKLLNGAGIMTFADLAAKPVADVKQVLTDAGSRYQMHNPATWGQQAGMAAKGEWDALKKLQDELDGGKPPVAASEEE
jgi:small subunit ribosomal protein S16